MSVRGPRRSYYFNEHKGFPFEYFVIPIILAVVGYGLFRVYEFWQQSRTPERAVTSIFNAIKLNDIPTLMKWTTLTEEEEYSLQFKATPEELVQRSLDRMTQAQVKIQSYTILKPVTSGQSARVPVDMTFTTRYRRAPLKGRTEVPLTWDKGQWWVSTEYFRTLPPRGR